MGRAGTAVCKRGRDIPGAGAFSCLASVYYGAFEDTQRSTRVSPHCTKKRHHLVGAVTLSHSLIPNVSKSNVNVCNKCFCTKHSWCEIPDPHVALSAGWTTLRRLYSSRSTSGACGWEPEEELVSPAATPGAPHPALTLGSFPPLK